MFHHILVPLDGSKRAEAALPVAARLAQATHGTVILTQVVETLTPYGPYLAPPTGPGATFSDKPRDDATTYLTTISQDPMLAGTHTLIRVTEGSPAESILALSEAESADLIVLCAHGGAKQSHWPFGHVALHIARHSRMPVLALREAGEGEPTALVSAGAARLERALVPLDGSTLAEAAIPATIELLAALAPQTGTVALLHVVDPQAPGAYQIAEAQMIESATAYLDRLAQQIRATPTEHLRLNVDTMVVIDTDPAERIIAVAKGEAAQQDDVAKTDGSSGGYDVIVMATHGRTGIARWALGSVAERVSLRSETPELIVRPIAAPTGVEEPVYLQSAPTSAPSA